MNKYYFKYKRSQINTGGMKAREDANQIFERSGYRPIRPFFICLKLLFLSRGSQIAVNFPKSRLSEIYILWLLTAFKKFRRVALVHDVFGFQAGRARWVNIQPLRQFEVVIVHNPKMKAWFLAQGFAEERLVELGIFDYLVSPKDRGIDGPGQKIIIAGSLSREKSAYIDQLGSLSSIDFNLYGREEEANLIEVAPNIHYEGSYSSQEILSHLVGDYGLVWDGTSLVGGQGEFGSYQAYNNPHKLSMYLAADLPVIVWSGAAVAVFVKTNHCGLVLNDLTDLETTLGRVGAEDYQEMKEQARQLGAKVRAGGYLTRALQEADEI